MVSRATDFVSLWKMGFGSVNSYSVLANGAALWPATLTGFVLLANLPQLALSVIYLMYNGLYTCMLLAEEWNGYTYDRKPLRVTAPLGQQRSSYYLHLPYTYAVPLLIVSGLLHWFVSQSIFLVRLDLYGDTGEFLGSDSNCGYSCIAIIFVILVGSLSVLAAIASGARRYKPGIPLSSSCSAAISATCHPPPSDLEPATLPVKWGVAATPELESPGFAGFGHCTLTTEKVSMPVAGRRYAGVRLMMNEVLNIYENVG